MGAMTDALKVTRKNVEAAAAGLNHQTWFINVKWRGIDFIHDCGETRTISGKSVRVPTLLELFESHPEYSKTEKVRIDVLRHFGYYSTESNGHLSEYLPWYRKRTDEIGKWIDLSSWINGETGGYLRLCTEGRSWFETDFPNWLKEQPPTIPGDRSEEHGSYIIESLETGRRYDGHFNIINRGHITNLPGRLLHRSPRPSGWRRLDDPRRRRFAPRLRGNVQRLPTRAGNGNGSGRPRGCNAPEAGDAARSTGRARCAIRRKSGRDGGGWRCW